MLPIAKEPLEQSEFEKMKFVFKKLFEELAVELNDEVVVVNSLYVSEKKLIEWGFNFQTRSLQIIDLLTLLQKSLFSSMVRIEETM